MTRAQARRGAKILQSMGFYAISIVEQYPEGEITLAGRNAAGMERTYSDLTDLLNETRN